MKYLSSGFLLVVRFCFARAIINGTEAIQNSIPHQVALVNTTDHVKCGGTILNKKFVLTAAHCFDTNDTFQVIAGEHDLLNDSDNAKRHYIANVSRHPDFKLPTSLR